ncbi:hypothetical protein EC988_003279 [Linderina pennispora]|nr:hypothetical protein EC988_003279 [Linderina pennispora]
MQWEAAVQTFRNISDSLQQHQDADLLTRAKGLGEMIGLANDANDQDLKQALIDDDIQRLAQDYEELKLQWLLSTEENADAAMTITAGAGGIDSCDWTRMLVEMYTGWAHSRSFRFSDISTVHGERAGYRTSTFRISGDFAFSWLKGEAGVHRLVRISPFDAKGKRHTSFASVLVYPIAPSYEKAAADIQAKDLRIDTFRSSGAGGQHVNKTESAVRITHIPTGITVECQAQRSQIQNRAACMELLQARLKQMENDKRQQEKAAERSQLPENAWGSQVRSYVLQPYQMVKDSRTHISTARIDAVLKGDIEQFLRASPEAK